MIIFAGLRSGSGEKEAVQKIVSYEYRKTALELGLLGSDEVVRAYNNMMQHFFQESPDSVEGLRLWGVLLLEIRKSLGNKSTKLTEVDMLRGMITDIERLES